MSNWLKSVDAWRVSKYGFSMERWEVERAKGKGQFVLRRALTCMVFMIAFHDVGNHIFYAGKEFSLWSYLGKYFILGIILGYVSWLDQENEYKKAVSLPASNLN